MDNVKITSKYKVKFCDLMKQVDLSHEFTLRDVISCCVNSEIPEELLGIILHCDYIEDLYKEMNSKKFKKCDSNINCLCLSLGGSKHTYKNKTDTSLGWQFDGKGKKGEMPEDTKKIFKDMKKKIRKDWIQGYAIEFTPVYKLADYKIIIDDKITIEDLDVDAKHFIKNIDFKPSITLIELLYAVFYELTFCGSPENRDKEWKVIKGRSEKIKKAIDNGTIDKITVPWEKVKADINKKIKEINKKKNK